jgi:hypothetical protein
MTSFIVDPILGLTRDYLYHRYTTFTKNTLSKFDIQQVKGKILCYNIDLDTIEHTSEVEFHKDLSAHELKEFDYLFINCEDTHLHVKNAIYVLYFNVSSISKETFYELYNKYNTLVLDFHKDKIYYL